MPADFLGLWFILPVALACWIGLFLHQPGRRPGNLAPVQLIAFTGSLGLGLTQLMILVLGALLIVEGRGPVWLLATPPLTAAAVLLTALVRSPRTLSGESGLPPQFAALAGDLSARLGASSTLGFDRMEAIVVAQDHESIEVVVDRDRTLTLRLRPRFLRWVQAIEKTTDAATVAALLRFIVFHELGHVLNGDHRTNRLSRAMSLAHLWWVLAAPIGAGLIALTAMFGSTDQTALRVATGWLAAATTTAMLSAGVQRRLAGRFVAQREEGADWRAIEMLTREEASRILGGEVVRGRTVSTLEQKLIKLKIAGTGEAGVLARLACWFWPAGPSIRSRVARLVRGEVASAHRPVDWAVLLGVQSGFVAAPVIVLIAMAVTTLDARVIVAVWTLTCLYAALTAYSILRLDPYRMRIAEDAVPARATFVAASHFSASGAATLFLLSTLLLPLKMAGVDVMKDWGVYVPTVLFVGAVVAGGTTWITTLHFDSTGVGQLEPPARESLSTIAPSLAAIVAPLPFGIVLSRVVELRAFAAWVPVWLLSFALLLSGTGLARHRRPLVRAIAPWGILDIAPPIWGIRLAWRDFMFDASRLSLPSMIARAGGIGACAGASAAILAVFFAELVQRRFGADAVWPVLFVAFLAISASILLMKGPREHLPWLRPELRLTSRSYLTTITGLISIASNADLAAPVRRWLDDSRLPGAILPTRREVWYVEHLWMLIRLAKQIDAGITVERWRPSIEEALREVVREDGGVSAWPGSPLVSLRHTSHALLLVEELGAASIFPAERMAARIEEGVAEQVLSSHPRLGDLAVAIQALGAAGRRLSAGVVERLPGIDPSASRHGRTPSLMHLFCIARAAGDVAALAKLRVAVLGRTWEILQRNPRREVAQLLDCCETAQALGLTPAAETTLDIAQTRLREMSTDLARQLVSFVNPLPQSIPT